MSSTGPRRPSPPRAAPVPSSVRRLETWLWTGPLGHLLGGGLDFARALARYLLAKYGPESTARGQK